MTTSIPSSSSSLVPASFSRLKTKFLIATQFLVVYTILVIVWGAWVRISHSGDGCGSHWPLCDGALIPTENDQKTWVEYTHRLTSGLYGIFVSALYILSFRVFPKNSFGRKVAFSTFLLMVIEALLGAALVLKGLVGENATLFRLVVMTLHQINSLLLVGSTVVLSFVSSKSEEPTPQRNGEGELKLAMSDTPSTAHALKAIVFTANWRNLFQSAPSLLLFIMIPATGAWAALANTLFPSSSLQAGILQDLAGAAPWILRLRVVHPILALGLGLYLVFFFFQKSEKTSGDRSKASLQLAAVLAVALLFGILTLLFLSPVWMKLVHLILAQITWVFLVRYAMISLLSTSR